MSVISPLMLQIKTATIIATNNKMEEHKLKDINYLSPYNLNLLIPETVRFLLHHTINLYFVLQLYVNSFK